MSHIGIGGNLIQPNKQCLSCKYWLDEWREFCKWIESLPYSEMITGKEDSDNE